MSEFWDFQVLRFPNVTLSQGPENENSNSDNNENPEAPLPKETLPLENDLETLENQMREVSANQEQLNKNFLELTELKLGW